MDTPCVYIAAGSLYPGDHNKGACCKCRDCRGKIRPGQGMKVYSWNGWTSFHLCQTCARWRVEGIDFYWHIGFQSWVFTFDAIKAEISGNTLAEIIWGAR